MRTKTSTTLLEHLTVAADQAPRREFIARYRPLILATSRTLGLSDDDAEYAARETLEAFAEACRQGSHRCEDGGIRDRLRDVAQNKIRQAYGRQSRDDKLAISRTGAVSFWDQIESEHFKVLWEKEWRRAVLRQCLTEARDQAAPRTFKAFELFALEQRSAAQVAVHLGVSQDEVYQSKSLVLEQIRELLPEMEKVW